MEKTETVNVYSTLDVAVSYLVSANSKRQAAETANFQLNEDSVQLEQISLVNDHGAKKAFKVERIGSIEWNDVEFTEYSSLFEVFGQIRLTLCLEVPAERHEDDLRQTVFYLPPSVLHDHSVWVIPTRNNPAFTSIVSQSMEWQPAAKEAAELFTVG